MEDKELLILVVDDEKDFREIVAAKLESAGFRVEQAENGLEALEKARKDKPNLILLDFMMPKMNGMETLSQLESDPELSKVKVIFLTNYGEAQEESSWLDQKFAKDVGADDYIKKSEDLDVIVDTIKKILQS